MKTSQWVGALVALVAVVFAVTYTRMFVTVEEPPKQRDKPKHSKRALELTFTALQFPPDFQTTGATLEEEHKKPNYHDFWFDNRNSEAVRVGVVSKSCKCQGIEVFVLPGGWQSPQGGNGAPQAAGAVGGGAVGPLGAVGAAQVAAAQTGASAQPDTRALEDKARKTDLNPHEPDGGEAEVPAHASGWVRMRWTGQTAGAQLLKAVLWTGDRNVGATTSLEVKAFFHYPVEVLEGERPLGVHDASDLPLETTLLCWSPTRDHFGLRAEAQGGRDPKSDPFTVGAPVPMTAAECRELERDIAARAAKKTGEVPEGVRSGYKVPVALRRVSADGKTPFDLGNFRRAVRLTPDIPGVEPIEVYVSGSVRGDVVVGSGDERVPLQFGTFDRGKAPRRDVRLRSTVPGLNLKLDRSRLPDYLEAKLSEPEADGPTRTWQLEVRVLADKVPAGEFPRDAAVYLQTVGPTPEAPSQAVRVPVGGNAVERGQ